MRAFQLLLVVGALGSGCLEHRSGSSSTSGAPFALIEHVDDAELTYDETLFRSTRKDGRFVNAVTLEGRTELSLTPPLPSELRYKVRIPDAPVLSFATAAATAGDETLDAPIALQMSVEVDGESTEVFADLIRRRAANRWRDHDVDLGRWAGREVELVVKSRFKAPREVRQPVLASWAHPVIASKTARSEKPHLVLISIDCLRADHVGTYGYPRETTPEIDAVARESTVFENAFSTASWTLPSHMSMLTGLLPSFHGATKWEKLASSVDYLPELLGKAGYRTSGVVSWVYLSQAYGFERGYDTYRVLDDPKASDIVDAAIEELRRGRGQSQFLFVHLYDAHWPYLPPSERLTEFGPRPRDISEILKKTGSQVPPADETEVEEAVRLYDGEIAFADAELGRLFRALKRAGMYDDTLLIITADHGEAFYEHGHWQHTLTLFDDLVNVPLIVKWPGSRKGSRVTALVSQTDIFPTLAEAAGVKLTKNETEGFLARASLASASKPRTVVSEVTWRSPSGTEMKVSFRDQRLKYIATLSGPIGDDLGVNEFAKEELYDLEVDPEEQKNLLPGRDGEAAPYRAELRAFLDSARAARSLRSGEAVELDDETLRKLESLGYTH